MKCTDAMIDAGIEVLMADPGLSTAILVQAIYDAMTSAAPVAMYRVRAPIHPRWMVVDEAQYREYTSHGWEGQILINSHKDTP